MPLLIFDIETVPDVQAGRKLYNLTNLDNTSVAKAMQTLRVQKVGHDFLPHHLQRVVAISLVLHSEEKLKVWSLGQENASEKEIIERFFSGIEQFTPTLISWNGSGFDLPVLHYRAMLHQISAPIYWEIGDNHQHFKWNNYISRFHYRHIDLMDVVSGFQPRAYAPLDEIATMYGFPGKMGMDGSKVWETFCNQDIKSIRDYCETDVLNTYLVYLRFEHMRGNLSITQYNAYLERLHQYLLHEKGKSHFQSFAKLCFEG